MTAALIVGCGVAGALVGVWLPVEVVPSEDGRTVAAGPAPIPTTVVHEPWGRAMVLATAGVWAGLAASFGAVWQLPADLVVGAGLVALTVIDVRHQLLPRRIVVPLGVARSRSSGWPPRPRARATRSPGRCCAPSSCSSGSRSSASPTRRRSAAAT